MFSLSEIIKSTVDHSLTTSNRHRVDQRSRNLSDRPMHPHGDQQCRESRTATTTFGVRHHFRVTQNVR